MTNIESTFWVASCIRLLVDILWLPYLTELNHWLHLRHIYWSWSGKLDNSFYLAGTSPWHAHSLSRHPEILLCQNKAGNQKSQHCGSPLHVGWPNVYDAGPLLILTYNIYNYIYNIYNFVKKTGYVYSCSVTIKVDNY